MTAVVPRAENKLPCGHLVLSKLQGLISGMIFFFLVQPHQVINSHKFQNKVSY